MDLAYPLKLDTPVFRRRPGGGLERLRFLQREHLGTRFELLDAQGQPTLVTARDASGENGGQGVRLTRLAGVRYGYLLKSCPRCEQIQPHQAFGFRRASGVLRDQSYCSSCRRGPEEE
ncbi:MAG: hypothetical protein H6741_26945 [Alphaproteobacteria bacterium]|nr:hypothetical protein [Alphaproteobacteria bacterium]MCB9796349.1 hypothetical protein [Alphaproteobacteria bacterium]